MVFKPYSRSIGKVGRSRSRKLDSMNKYVDININVY
jgi:hypothetical protein